MKCIEYSLVQSNAHPRTFKTSTNINSLQFRVVASIKTSSLDQIHVLRILDLTSLNAKKKKKSQKDEAITVNINVQ